MRALARAARTHRLRRARNAHDLPANAHAAGPRLRPSPQSWLDRERLILGTKSNHLLEVTLTPDVSRSNIREIPLPDCRKRTNVVPEDMEHCGIHAISLSPSRTRIVTGGLLPCDAVVLEATPDGGYKSLGVFTVR